MPVVVLCLLVGGGGRRPYYWGLYRQWFACGLPLLVTTLVPLLSLLPTTLLVNYLRHVYKVCRTKKTNKDGYVPLLLIKTAVRFRFSLLGWVGPTVYFFCQRVDYFRGQEPYELEPPRLRVVRIDRWYPHG